MHRVLRAPAAADRARRSAIDRWVPGGMPDALLITDLPRDHVADDALTRRR
ncbi:hypothetical protein ABFT23_18125 [Nocardioides sp. C4-1]|uniref:hypothetical protein n=1 Tax=Nocardioides sp. C4-1 TaxID=3151851 RepID=UPI003267E524